jgi:glutamate-1-semialdehyde 2,1-aminomutase
MAQVKATSISEEYTRRTSRAQRLYARAKEVIPSGVTHDVRYMEPYPIYVERAAGPRKWDVDGNEYVDYVMGHGALLLGHNHPTVLAAASEQLGRGTHYGACHELEVRWAELVRQIVPSAEKVKFLSSGTEATMMAMRLARAFTGKNKIIKIDGHFHGWHDYATVAMKPPYDVPDSAGVPKATADTILHVPFKDVEAVRQVLDTDPDVAGLILLCNEAGSDYLAQVRDLTRERGVVLIFDEVVTGFRYAPGGCQEYFGVTPDLTTLAKILAGGFPGGAVAGREDILKYLENRDDDHWLRFGRIYHPGTFNANPLSSSAGVATLEIVQDPSIQKQATATADDIRAGINDVFEQSGVDGSAGGEVSIIPMTLSSDKLPSRQFVWRFRAAMQLAGVDLMTSLSLFVSYVHTEREVEDTLRAFGQAISRLQAEGAL